MSGIDFLQSLNDIDDDLLAEAEQKENGKKVKRSTLLLAAACLLMGVFGTILGKELWTTHKNQQTLVCFTLAEDVYEVPRVEDYIHLGLLSADQTKSSNVHLASLTRADLGAWMGDVVIQTEDGTMVSKAYHYAGLPKSEEVCVVMSPDGETFTLYVKRGETE